MRLIAGLYPRQNHRFADIRETSNARLPPDCDVTATAPQHLIARGFIGLTANRTPCYPWRVEIALTIISEEVMNARLTGVLMGVGALGFLVAPGGRNKGHLRICVTRPANMDGDSEVPVLVSSEVGAFVPMLTFPGLRKLSGFGRWIYRQTQLRIHVIVTHAFLRSLANLELEQSEVGSLRVQPPAEEPVA
jgi:hypothetical protein